MNKLQFKKIDAFATKQSDGNPAGYVRLNSILDLTESEMQQIAKELKGFVNEVGYIAQTSEKCFSLKFFSSECEVDFCGHATIAIMYDIIKNDDKIKKFETVEILTNRGVLQVKNLIEREDAVYIMSPDPIFIPLTICTEMVSGVLGIEASLIKSDEPLSIINAGLTTLIVPIKSLDAILQISPDMEDLKTFCIQSDIDIVEVFTSDVVDCKNDYRVRVFAPKFGYLEDPATGSGNSALGYYFIKNNRFKREMIIVEQNRHKNRFNIINIRKETDIENNTRVLFGGSAITRIDGHYFLQ